MYYSNLRALARTSLKGNWTAAIGLFVVSFLICGIFELIIGPDDSLLSWKDAVSAIISILLIPMTIGLGWAWVDLSRSQKISFKQLTEPYQTMFGKAIATGILQGILLFLWLLLLVVPGIIKSFSYMLTYYILRDDPGLSPLQAITKSRRMMDGNKGKALLLGLSFIGWFFVGVLTLGIAFLWIVPYVSVTFAHFYNTVRIDYEKKSF